MMDELIAACFIFLHSYGVEPIDTIQKPIVTINSSKEIKDTTGSFALGACINGHIYINDQVDLKTVFGKSIVCHELVHFAQNKCPVQSDNNIRLFLEHQAYQLQNQYLRDNGEKIRAHNPNEPEDASDGYTRPRVEITPIIPSTTKEELPDKTRARFEAIEHANDKAIHRPFHSRFEDEVLDEIKIKEYNSRTR
jgi:hypothetical protein